MPDPRRQGTDSPVTTNIVCDRIQVRLIKQRLVVLNEIDHPSNTETAARFAAAHSLNTHADKNGYIVVYPQSSHFIDQDARGNFYRVTSWNDLAANLDPKPEGQHCLDDAAKFPCPPECDSCNRCG